MKRGNMASYSGSEVKAKDSHNMHVDVDFQWGKMPQQELTGQFTRSMVEMRKPKAYELAEPPILPNNQPDIDQSREEIKIPKCPITIHSIRLLKYIRQVQDMTAKLQGSSHAVYSYGTQISALSQPPEFKDENPRAAPLRRSRSSSSGKSVDAVDKSLFSAPEPDSEFRSGLKTVRFPQMDDETASRILKKSVATVAAHAGYEESMSSSVNLLTGVTEAFMSSFSKSLRNTLDAEAETGRTAFFDSLDHVLHESGSCTFKDIQRFRQTRIVKRHKNLQKQAEKLSQTLQSMKYPKDVTRQIKPEKIQPSPASYGKWTPVTGMSSSPFSSGRPVDTMTSGPSWAGQSFKPEPHDNGAYPSSGTPHQESSRVKSEYGDLESSADMFSTEKTEDNFALDSFYTMDDYRPAKKKTRNT